MPISLLFILDCPFPSTTKKAIDAGDVPRDAVTYCDLTRSALFTSNDFRKERELWFYHAADNTALKLDGKRLRYLGPDARSQLMLLLKAWQWASMKTQRITESTWKETTPGFTVGVNVTREEAIDAFLDSNGNRVPFLLDWNEVEPPSPISTIDTIYMDSINRPGVSSIIVQDIKEIRSIVESTAQRGRLIETARLSARLQAPLLPSIVLTLNLLEDACSP